MGTYTHLQAGDWERRAILDAVCFLEIEDDGDKRSAESPRAIFCQFCQASVFNLHIFQANFLLRKI